MITRCCAKVNLRLRVFAHDDQGFHSVETLLARTDLSDRLEIEETSGGVTIDMDGPEADGIPSDDGNLCCKAARAFMRAAFPSRRSPPGVAIHLTKHIPSGSGLGGGSMDAAATLRLLSERWRRVEPGTLFDLSGRLGSDVAFGLLDVPMALGWERGRRLLPLRPPRARPALLCCPPFAVATPAAYGWLREARAAAGGDDPVGGAAVFPGATRLAQWNPIERLIHNDLEAPVVERHPELKRALEILRSTSHGAAMTGSGSTLFAVLENETDRRVATEAMRAAGFGELEEWRLLDVILPI